MGTKAKIALGAGVGIVVIGAVSANAGSDGSDGKDRGPRGTGKACAASAEHESGAEAGGGSSGKKGSGDAGKAAEKKAAFDGVGEYQVGSDVKPRTYRTTGDTDGMCYSKRTKDTGHALNSIVAEPLRPATLSPGLASPAVASLTRP
ncbi:hypothetical protein ACGFT2_09800 [Streptomyces sp. NPDC048514]|uniref:hypothetical protein n=1 Tax=Streptomyces sp. NPDC048514 TaxID=3365564 RepID=UPI0037227BBF